MALDPSIALNVQPYQGPNMGSMMGMAKTAQDIQNAQQQNQLLQAWTQNAQAQTPGIQAQSQVSQQAAVNAQREAQAQQMSAQIIAKNTKTNPDGTQTLDAVGASNDFAAAGLADQSSKILKPYLDNISQNQDIVQKLQKNSDDMQTFQLKVMGPMLNTASKIADPEQRAAYLDKAYAGAEAQYPQLFPKGSTPYADNLVQRAKVDPVGAASFASTPLDWMKFGVDKQNAETARISAQAAAVNAQTGVVTQAQGAVAATQDALTKASTFGNGAAAVDGMRDPTTGALPEGIAALKGDQLKRAIETDPNYAAVKSSIAQAVTAGIPVTYDGGLTGVQQQLNLAAGQYKDAAARVQATQANAGRPMAGPTAPTAPTAGPAPTAQPSGIAPPRAAQTGNSLAGQEYGPTKLRQYAQKYGMTTDQVKAAIIKNGGAVTSTDY